MCSLLNFSSEKRSFSGGIPYGTVHDFSNSSHSFVSVEVNCPILIGVVVWLKYALSQVFANKP